MAEVRPAGASNACGPAPGEDDDTWHILPLNPMTADRSDTPGS
jgi:hypothetical protein